MNSAMSASRQRSTTACGRCAAPRIAWSGAEMSGAVVFLAYMAEATSQQQAVGAVGWATGRMVTSHMWC